MLVVISITVLVGVVVVVALIIKGRIPKKILVLVGLVAGIIFTYVSIVKDLDDLLRSNHNSQKDHPIQNDSVVEHPEDSTFIRSDPDEDLVPPEDGMEASIARESAVPKGIREEPVSPISAPSDSAEITIFTNPKGAQILIDGQSFGASDKTVNLPIGRHSIEIRMQGYVSHIDKINLPEQNTFHVDLREE